MKKQKNILLFFGLFCLILFAASCAPGNTRFTESPAGFFAGLWHGLICVITFIISLFTDKVNMYEINNSGAWYDLGFIIGIAIIWGGGHGGTRKKRIRCAKEKEWEDIGKKVEEKIRKGIKSWVDETEKEKGDWEEIGKKIEEKIKRELRTWAEK